MSKVKVLKLVDVQAELGVSRWTLYEWLKNGKLRGFKLPCGHYRVPADELVKLRSQEVESGENR
jgi:excisionase family DNA binding protein